MPLNYDLNKIKRFKSLYEQSVETTGVRLKKIPETIILSTMSVGMRSITEDNYVKFFNRLRILETVHGPFLYKRTKRGATARLIELDDVKRMIGLDTNASEISRSKFIARIEKDLL
jgi:hypothetical protein